MQVQCTTAKGMQSFGFFQVEEIELAVEELKRREPISVPNLQKRHLASSRIRLFVTKGVVCSTCELEANIFSLEQHLSQQTLNPHLNLYNWTEDKFTLFTKDHIIPRHYGGPDHIANYATMCSPCNQKRGHKLPTRSAALQVLEDLKEAHWKFAKKITLPNLEAHELPILP